jgi:anthranilate/para-aminobenzoate synthase component I
MADAQVLPWIDPAEAFIAASCAEGPVAFLHSSQATSYSGRYSWLAWGAQAALESEDWQALEAFLNTHASEDIPCFGYLSYEMLHGLEEVPRCTPSPVSLPPIQLFTPRTLWRFDHVSREVQAWGEHVSLPMPPPLPKAPKARVAELQASMTKAQYLASVDATREAIRAGAFYQANLTRKFHGQWADAPEGPALFLALLQASPAPYSAYLRFGEAEILSSSPELFLRTQPGGMLETRPIKGTLRRGDDISAERAALEHSTKDRAENLMIVDLMRNDLARVAEPGSIDASRRFEVDSFRTIHHLSSTVTAKLSPGHTYLDAIKAAFPPGSMTGAPKVAAMRWCAQQERVARGVYSGALGWMGRDACELSVVIRTLVLSGSNFEFQVGGGIVADSEPLAEWWETLAKARGIALTLGISEETLELI